MCFTLTMQLLNMRCMFNVNPFKLWLAVAGQPFDAWRHWHYWTPAHKAANGHGLT